MSWICPNCERELKKENQWHNCVKVSLDTLFEGVGEDLILAFDKILAEVSSWDEVIVSTTKNCVVFVHHQTFLIIKPMKKALDLKFYSKSLLQGGLILKSNPHAGRYENHLRVTNSEQCAPLAFKYLYDSYKLL